MPVKGEVSGDTTREMPKIPWIGAQHLRPAEVAASHANLALQLEV